MQLNSPPPALTQSIEQVYLDYSALMRFTGDRSTGRLLGVQLFGHTNAEIAKRIDIAATAIFHGMTVDGLSDLDLSYTPPLGSPWEAVQMGAQAWLREASHH